MWGWSRTSLKQGVKARAFWFCYGVVVAQTLVIVAYFLPWSQSWARPDTLDEGLLGWVYSELTSGPRTSEAFFLVALMACFLAAFISLILTVFTFTKNGKHGLVLCASSSLNSLAIAGPLLYIHRHLPWPIGSDWSDLWSAVGEMEIGWFIALLSGSASGLLILYMYNEACKSFEGNRDSRERPPARPHRAPFFLAFILTSAFGGAAAIIGFLQTWNSGSAISIMGLSSWSNNGFEVSPLMYLVPAATVLSWALFILSRFIMKTRSPVLLQAAQNLLIVTFALTLFWGLAFGEFRHVTVDVAFTAKLQFGWYLCVIGQLMMLVSIFLYHRFGSTAPRNRKIWHV